MQIQNIIGELEEHYIGKAVGLAIKEGAVFPVGEFSEAIEKRRIPVDKMTTGLLINALARRNDTYCVKSTEHFPVIIFVKSKKQLRPGSPTYTLLSKISPAVKRLFLPHQHHLKVA